MRIETRDLCKNLFVACLPFLLASCLLGNKSGSSGGETSVVPQSQDSGPVRLSDEIKGKITAFQLSHDKHHLYVGTDSRFYILHRDSDSGPFTVFREYQAFYHPAHLIKGTHKIYVSPDDSKIAILGRLSDIQEQAYPAISFLSRQSDGEFEIHRSVLFGADPTVNDGTPNFGVAFNDGFTRFAAFYSPGSEPEATMSYVFSMPVEAVYDESLFYDFIPHALHYSAAPGMTPTLPGELSDLRDLVFTSDSTFMVTSAATHTLASFRTDGPTTTFDRKITRILPGLAALTSPAHLVRYKTSNYNFVFAGTEAEVPALVSTVMPSNNPSLFSVMGSSSVEDSLATAEYHFNDKYLGVPERNRMLAFGPSRIGQFAVNTSIEVPALTLGAVVELDGASRIDSFQMIDADTLWILDTGLEGSHVIREFKFDWFNYLHAIGPVEI